MSLNLSILVSSLKYLKFFKLAVSLSSWIYQELCLVKYTDDKLVRTFELDDLVVIESIISLNQNKDLLTDLLKDLGHLYVLNKPRRLVKDSEVCPKVKLLLEAGADVHVDNEYPIYTASSYKCTETIKVMLQFGANVNTRKYETPLFWSCRAATSIETAKVLIEAGANVNINWSEALRIAISFPIKSLELTELLLKSGANANHVGAGTILNLKRDRHMKLAELLEKHRNNSTIRR